MILVEINVQNILLFFGTKKSNFVFIAKVCQNINVFHKEKF